MEKIWKIGLLDHFLLLREALRWLLERNGNFQVVAESGDAFEALALVKKTKPEMVVLEPSLPGKDGLDLVAELRDLSSRVLVLTVDATMENAFRLLRAGASGWLPKTSGSTEVLTALNTLREGRLYLPEYLQKYCAEKYLGNQTQPPEPLEQLTNREFQVLRLLAQGQTCQEIAELLFIAPKTVDTHRANLMKKLGLKNNAVLTRFAIRQGVIEA